MKREIKDDLFASRVKAIRKRLKLKQVPFADKLNISVTKIRITEMFLQREFVQNAYISRRLGQEVSRYPIAQLLALCSFFLLCLNWTLLSKTPPKSLREIYATGKIEYTKELEINRDSLPENVHVKMMGNFEVWNNHIYVADPQLFEIKIFDISGKYRKKFGQKGKGPSDLYHPLSLCSTGDKLVVWENLNFRFSTFDPNGKFIAIAKAGRNTGLVRKIKALDDGRLIVERELSGNIKGEYIQYFGLELYSRDIEFVKILYKKRVLRNKYITKPRRTNIIQPFPSDVSWDVLPGNKVVIGVSGNYKLEILNPTTGESKTFFGKFKPVKISALDKKVFFDSIVSGSRDRMVKGVNIFHRENTKFPSHKPAFKGIICDFEGNILVFIYKKIDDGKPGYIAKYFDVFDSSGNFINQVEIVSPKWLSIINIFSRKDNLFWLIETRDDFDNSIVAYRAKAVR